MFYSKIVALLFILSATLKADLYGPITTCAGPYACFLSSYLGLQFPDGSNQVTASGISTVGTIDTATPSVNGSVITGAVLLMQSASATRPGLINTGAQTIAGAKVLNSTLAVNSGVAAANAALVFKNGHLKSTITTAPTAAPNANAGTGATCTLATATDAAGVMTLTTTAVAPSLGAQCALTFNAAYNVAPICVFSPGNANTAVSAPISGVYVTTSTTLMTVSFAAADVAGGVYVLAYHCMETQ